MCLYFPVFSMWYGLVAGVEAIYAADSMSYVYIYFFILQVSLLTTLRSLKHRLAAGEW